MTQSNINMSSFDRHRLKAELFINDNSQLADIVNALEYRMISSFNYALPEQA